MGLLILLFVAFVCVFIGMCIAYALPDFATLEAVQVEQPFSREITLQSHEYEVLM